MDKEGAAEGGEKGDEKLEDGRLSGGEGREDFIPEGVGEC